MVLGCILCRQPLVTFSNIRDKKRHYLKGQLQKKSCKTSTAEKQANTDNLTEIKEAQLVLSKCGHLFHKTCLKIYLTHQPNGNGTKRECPFCFKPVTLAQSIPVFLNVESNDLLIERVQGICKANDELHEKLTNLKSELAKKNIELKEINEEVATCRLNVSLQTEEINKIVKPTRSVQTLQGELMSREKFVRVLADQNSKLVSLIEKQASRNQKPKCGESRQFPDEPNTFGTDKFRLDEKRSGQNVGVFFNSPPLCKEYLTQKPASQIRNPIVEREQDFFPKVQNQSRANRPRHTPKGAKYLEYRQKQLLAQVGNEQLNDNNDNTKIPNSTNHTTSIKLKHTRPETIRQVVELTRVKRLKKCPNFK